MQRNKRSIIGHVEELRDAGFKELANVLARRVKRHIWGCYNTDYSNAPLKLRGHQVERFRELSKQIRSLYDRELEDFISTYRNPPTLKINKYDTRIINLSTWMDMPDPILIFHEEYASYIYEVNRRRKKYCREALNFPPEDAYYYNLLLERLNDQAREFIGVKNARGYFIQSNQ